MRQIPKIGQVLVHLDIVPHLGIRESQISDRFIKADAQRNCHRVAHSIAHISDDFLTETRAVFQAATVFIAPLIGGAAKEMLEDAKAMRAVKTDQVKASLL